MTCVLDASVAVAALRIGEPRHEASLQRCQPIFAGLEQIIVPAIFDVEVTAALVRRGVPAERVIQFLDSHLVTRKIVVIGPRAARSAQRVVKTTRLRAADAVYVWVASRYGVPLVTADEEVLQRAPLAGVDAILP
ncbi:MAG: type II toxin-antitoxin system VapC family toxin [Deltaproteobacteria bacterium]|nr:type II toxin-antitoxin system VapC family toxin [Deltaproteobacteria bacterium]